MTMHEGLEFVRRTGTLPRTDGVDFEITWMKLAEQQDDGRWVLTELGERRVALAPSR